MGKGSQKQFSTFLPFYSLSPLFLWVTDTQKEHVVDLFESPIINAIEVTILVPALACEAFILRKKKNLETTESLGLLGCGMALPAH